MFDEASLQYWQELRWRLSFVLGFFFAVFLFAYYQSNAVYDLITWPVLNILKTPFVALSLTDTIIAPLRLSWTLAWLMTVPCFFYQLFAFLLPALYQHEQKLFFWLLSISVLLYYLGVLFSVAVVSPILVFYVKSIIPSSVQYMPDMKVYVEFIIYLGVCFGWAFELPMVMVFSAYMRWLCFAQMAAFRRYFILIAFIVGMLLTPPDVLSQCILAVPICLIFETGLIMVYVAERWVFPKQLPASNQESLNESP